MLLIFALAAVPLAIGVRITPRPKVRPEGPLDVDAAARLMLIGLTAGLSMTTAIEMAVVELGHADELSSVVRASRISGVASALASATGPAAALFRRLARAHATGASASGSIEAFITDRRLSHKTETLERLRRLPVALTVPLTLLILPGFILLTLGPTVASIVQQLLGGLF